MFDLEKEVRNIQWIEQQHGNANTRGSAEIEGEHVLRTFHCEKGHSHEMRYGGEEDVSFRYVKISLTTFDNSWEVITLTQKYYDDGEQDIEIDLDVLPNESTVSEQVRKELAVGAVLMTSYSLHENGEHSPLGSGWKGNEQDRPFLLKKGLIHESMLPPQIDVDASARNILVAAQRLDFSANPQQLLIPMTK